MSENDQEFRYSAAIAGQSDGSMSFYGNGTSISGFLTNRTGFVVLHPIEGVAGAACTVEHVDGTIEETRFPFLVNPVQPMTDLRAVTHEFLPGLKVTCRMEGDTFEMEDQRNWTDASYKTYVRPLALPWPYVIAKGETIDQTVTLKVSGTVSEIKAVESRLVLTVGEQTAGRAMPPLGLGLDPKEIDATEQSLGALRHVAPRHLVCYYDPRLGHREADLKRMAAIGKALGAELWLEFVIPSVDHFEQDLQETRPRSRLASVIHLPRSWSRRLRISNARCQAVPGLPAHHWIAATVQLALLFLRQELAAECSVSSRN